MGITRPRDNTCTTPNGFTLIELMVVMLMITIVLAVAFPRFDGGMLQDSTKQVTRRMIQTVRTLRGDAVRRQQIQTLTIDLENQRLWVTHAAMDEQMAATAADKAYQLPDAVRFVEVQYPNRDPVNTGKAEIYFYPAGYSDHVVVHFQNENQERFSYVVEPLLPKVRLLEEWIDL